MSSTEVLESNVVALQSAFVDLKADFKEHRKDFIAAMARLDYDIKSAVAELRAEIRTMAAQAESDLKDFAGRVEAQLAEMRAEDKSLRHTIHRNYEILSGKIDATHTKLDITNDKLTDLTKTVDKIGSRLNAFFWAIGGLIAVGTFVITVGKAVGWF